MLLVCGATDGEPLLRILVLIIDQRDTGLQLRDLVSREGREFVDILPSFYCW